MRRDPLREIVPPPPNVWLRPSDLTPRDQVIWTFHADAARDVSPRQPEGAR